MAQLEKKTGPAQAAWLRLAPAPGAAATLGGVRSELSSGIESLELPGSVLVGRDGVPWGLGVLGRLVSFWRVATIRVSASCSRLLTLSVSSSVDDLLWMDSLSESES